MNLLKVYKNKLLKGMILLFLVLMLLYPASSFKGASSGLLLWFHNVLPNLLPFIIISNLMVRLNITRQISKVFHPVLGRLFRVSGEGCYPIIIGFLSGIPMGAKTSADLVSEHRITRREGQFLLTMCNNASPMFIIGYIAITQLKLPQIKYALFVIIYGSAILGALLYRLITDRFSHSNEVLITTENEKQVLQPSSGRFRFELIDNAIMNGFEIVTRIGGYIILFSILAQIMKEAGPGSGIIKAVLMGLLEITTGISQICNLSIETSMKIVLVTVLTSFGGFSGIAQTKSVLQNSRLSIKSYMFVKILSAAIAILLSLLYVTFCPIQ